MSLNPEPNPLRRDADGVLRVGNTRVTLDTVVETFLQGDSPEEITEQYPSLDLAEVYAVIAYYLRHRAEVEDYLKERQRQADAVRQENEARFPPEGIRARLLARRNPQG
jgi:uncharacterized protein (DUF433 family)